MDQTTIERSEHKLNEVDIDLRELFKALFHYKWSILFTSLLILLIGAFYLYFKTPIYNSYAIIEVKSSGTQDMQEGDLLGSAFTSFSNENVDKEIEILQTVNIY